MRTCADFEGRCCESCHIDADEFDCDMCEVYDKGGALFAIVCCGKSDAAHAARDAAVAVGAATQEVKHG